MSAEPAKPADVREDVVENLQFEGPDYNGSIIVYPTRVWYLAFYNLCYDDCAWDHSSEGYFSRVAWDLLRDDIIAALGKDGGPDKITPSEFV